MIIVNPGIKVDNGYKTYDNGIEMGVFIRVCIMCSHACMLVHMCACTVG